MQTRNKPGNATMCPCGGGLFSACCGRFVAQHALPQTAEELMRSRYTAYTLRDDVYLRATWHHSTRPVSENIAADDAGMKWLGLDIRKHQPGSESATVEFVARYKIGGRAERLHEVSQFVREPVTTGIDQQQTEMRWFYVDGVFPEK